MSTSRFTVTYFSGKTGTLRGRRKTAAYTAERRFLSCSMRYFQNTTCDL